MLLQNLFKPNVLNYSWLGVVCTDCLLPATRLQMKVTAMLLLCQVLHALCHCTQCSSDMGIFFCKYIFQLFFVCLLDLGFSSEELSAFLRDLQIMLFINFMAANESDCNAIVVSGFTCFVSLYTVQ